MEAAAEAVGDAAGEEPERAVALALLRATRDPDVQRGLGFAVATLRALGRTLDGDADRRE
ncbi:MAG: DUF1641 domain-containing protein [Halobacteriaceae archaeon]